HLDGQTVTPEPPGDQSRAGYALVQPLVDGCIIGRAPRVFCPRHLMGGTRDRRAHDARYGDLSNGRSYCERRSGVGHAGEYVIVARASKWHERAVVGDRAWAETAATTRALRVVAEQGGGVRAMSLMALL